MLYFFGLGILILPTSSLAPCRTASFDHTGNLVATGCADGTVKIVDVNRVLQNARDTSLPPRDPVVRVFHDHQRVGMGGIAHCLGLERVTHDCFLSFSRL